MTNKKFMLRDGNALEEWNACGASVGINCPGAMQQAKHMADAAVAALGLEYRETAPVDITDGIEILKRDLVNAKRKIRLLESGRLTPASRRR